MTTITIDDKGGWSIIDGPSREELFDALRLCAERRTPAFTLTRPGLSQPIRVYVYVAGIEPESGDGHSWILKLQIDYAVFDGISGESVEITNQRRIVVWFNDKSPRRGRIVDARSHEEVVSVDREGVIRKGSRSIGSIADMPVFT